MMIWRHGSHWKARPCSFIGSSQTGHMGVIGFMVALPTEAALLAYQTHDRGPGHVAVPWPSFNSISASHRAVTATHIATIAFMGNPLAPAMAGATIIRPI
jgi:hypothetical protein